MSHKNEINQEIQEFSTNKNPVFCLPVISNSWRTYGQILSQSRTIVDFLAKTGCKVDLLKGTCKSGNENQECIFIFAHNAKGVESEDYFRYLFFDIGKILSLQCIIYKDKENNVSRILTDIIERISVGLQEPVDVINLSDTENILSSALNLDCELSNLIKTRNPFGGMNGAMMREQIFNSIYKGGPEALCKILGVPELDLSQEFSYIYTKREEATINLLKNLSNGEYPEEILASYFLPDLPIYFLTAYRNDRSLINNIRRQSQLKLLMNEAGMLQIFGINPDTHTEYIFAQNALSIQGDTFFQKMFNLVSDAMDLPFIPKTLTLELAEKENLELSGGNLPTPEILGAAERDKLSRIVNDDPERFAWYLQKIFIKNIEKESYFTRIVDKPDSIAFKILEFIDRDADTFILSFNSLKGENVDKHNISEKLAKILSAASCKGLTVYQSENDDKPIPVLLIASHDMMDENPFLLLLLSSCKALNLPSGLFKSYDTNFYEVEVDSPYNIEHLGSGFLESWDELSAYLKQVYKHSLVLNKHLTLKEISPVKGMNAVDHKAQFIGTMEEYGVNGVSKLLGMDVEPLPFEEAITQEDIPIKEPETPDGPYFTIKGKPFKLPI